MDNSSILDNTIHITNAKRSKATHFALCNQGKIRYLITRKKGLNRLRRSLSCYSYKLAALIRLLDSIPYGTWPWIRLGHFVKAELSDELKIAMEDVTKQRFGTSDYKWNVIVGTYDDKQKLVFQCFAEGKPSLYVKVGLLNTDRELRAEMDFLKDKPKFSSFEVPEMLASRRIEDGNQLNIMITEEFIGDKINPTVTEEIWRVFKEISGYKQAEARKSYAPPKCFSHGDLAPWNMRLKGKNYIVFDWEHCGFRFYGYDFIHYIYQIETLLRGKSEQEAVLTAVSEFQKYDGNHIKSEVLIRQYFAERERCFKNNR